MYMIRARNVVNDLNKLKPLNYPMTHKVSQDHIEIATRTPASGQPNEQLMTAEPEMAPGTG